MAFDTLEINLPSNGKFGYQSKVTVRNLTGADEKIMYAGSSEIATDKLIRRCVTEPEDFDVTKLCEQDKYYILLKVRVLTYGSDYTFDAKCPECGRKTSLTVSLDDLEVVYADDEMISALSIELPASKDKLRLKVLTTREINEVNQRIAKLKADRGTEYILRCASIIESINDDVKTLTEKQSILENMSSKDINFIWKSYSKINLGVNMNTTLTCPNCGSMREVKIDMNSEFFRPSFGD